QEEVRRRAEGLYPVPRGRPKPAAATENVLEPLVQVAEEFVVLLLRKEQTDEALGPPRGAAHGPWLSGMPSHMAISSSRTSRSCATPASVSVNRRFARPPRSGVGSPMEDSTSSFSSRRRSVR